MLKGRLAKGREPIERLELSYIALTNALSGGNQELNLILFDFLLPLLLGIIVFIWTGNLTESIFFRFALGLFAISAQELLSFGSVIFWSPNLAPWNFQIPFFDRTSYSQFIPQFSSSYFTVFRTPEPQVSWCVAFLFFLIWNRNLAISDWRKKEFFSFALLYSGLSFSYIFVSFPLVVLSLFMSAYYLLCKNFFKGSVVLFFSCLTFVLKWIYNLGHETQHYDFLFHSRLPVITPSIVYILLAFLLLGRSLTKVLKSKNDEKIFYILCLFLPIILLNHQVVTNIMVTTKDYELNINYILLVVGFFSLLKLGAHSLFFFLSRPFVGVCSASLLAILIFLGLKNTYHGWRYHNEVSLKYLSLINQYRVGDEEILLKEAPEVAPLVELRNGSSLNFSLNFNDAQNSETLVKDMISPDVPPEGREIHQEKVFRYFARLGYAPAQFGEILQKEISRGKGYFFLPFLFSIKDTWYPLTEARLVKKEWVLSQIVELEGEYETFRKRSPVASPALILAQKPIDKGLERLHLTLLREDKLQGRRKVFVYRQSP